MKFDPDQQRIELLRAQNAQRLSRVYAQAVGELPRLAGMTPDADGKVDPMKLDSALAGKSIEARLPLEIHAGRMRHDFVKLATWRLNSGR